MNILGFPAVNRDLTVEVRDAATQNLIREVKPFLDGTVRVPNIDPGAYEITVRHPNIALPVLRRPIRVLPVGDTKVSVLIDPSQFRNTPIEQVPEANLTPVRDIARSVAETVSPLTSKHPAKRSCRRTGISWGRPCGTLPMRSASPCSSSARKAIRIRSMSTSSTRSLRISKTC